MAPSSLQVTDGVPFETQVPVARKPVSAAKGRCRSIDRAVSKPIFPLAGPRVRISLAPAPNLLREFCTTTAGKINLTNPPASRPIRTPSNPADETTRSGLKARWQPWPRARNLR
jgi:hypothetical protein